MERAGISETSLCRETRQRFYTFAFAPQKQHDPRSTARNRMGTFSGYEAACTSRYPSPHPTAVLIHHGLTGFAMERFLELGMFETTPLVRYFSGECGSMVARRRLVSSRLCRTSFVRSQQRSADRV